MFFGLEKGPESKLGHTCFCFFLGGGNLEDVFFWKGWKDISFGGMARVCCFLLSRCILIQIAFCKSRNVLSGRGDLDSKSSSSMTMIL